MRSYPSNSPQAAGRILALSMVVDGNLAESELDAMGRTRILQHVALTPEAFQLLLEDLCNDLLTSAVRGVVQVERAMIEAVLAEITQPDLRRQLLRAMWSIADADGWLADGEAVLLARAADAWSAEFNFSDRAGKRSLATAA